MPNKPSAQRRTSIISSIVVNWLNSRTLCPRLNNSPKSRSSSSIFPLAPRSSASRAASASAVGGARPSEGEREGRRGSVVER